MNESDRMPPVMLGAVVLGAGRSSRMGRPKLLLPWAGTSVLGHLLRVWSELGAAQVAVVCALNDAGVEAELDRLDFSRQARIRNPAPEAGMFSSIQCAARWPNWRPDLTHWAVILGDQPHLRAQTLRQILELAQARPKRVCQLTHGGHKRHPVILPKAVFEELAGSDASTLKEFLQNAEKGLLEVDDPGLDLDIDRPEDYSAALRFSSDAAAAPAPAPVPAANGSARRA